MRSMEVQKLDTKRDRLSDLPDDLLSHILSLLPIKDAVRTSTLSKSWKNLYTLVPILKFKDSGFGEKGFMNTVDRVLFARKRIDLDKFVLTCGQAVNPLRAEGWVQYALWHNVRELELDFMNLYMGYKVPAGLFTCKTLVSLKLTMTELKIPCKVSLPNLKILCLEFVVFSADDSIERFFSSCSALEELVLQSCCYRKITRFRVFNSTLKRLTISHFEYAIHVNEVLINAPSLVYIKYKRFMAKDHVLIDLRSLVEAYIDFGSTHSCDFYGSATTDLIRGLGHVQSLYLSGPLPPGLLLGHGPILTLENLTKLTIGTFYSEGWESLLHFAPCLETLVFEKLPYFKENMNPPKEVPCCLISRIKTIKFLLLGGNKSNMQMVEYFLKHGRVLENLIIHLVTRKDRLSKITEKLLKFPKVSEKCQVQVLIG